MVLCEPWRGQCVCTTDPAKSKFLCSHGWLAAGRELTAGWCSFAEILFLRMQASSGGLLGRFKSLFNLSEASNPQNPSPNDVSKDIANRLSGGGGISAIDEQSPGALMVTSK